MGLKHLPNPEKLWKAVSDIYTEKWLVENWGKIKPTPMDKIKTLSDNEFIDLGSNRKLKAYHDPGHAKHHYSFYDDVSKTLFIGDTLGLIYPHGNFVQPNLPPPDFDKEILFETLEKFEKLELNNLALAHFGIHKNPYDLITNAKESIEVWIKFIENLPETSNQEASAIMEQWVRTNYEFLGIDKETIDNYTNNVHFEMQVAGIRNYLLKKNNP